MRELNARLLLAEVHLGEEDDAGAAESEFRRVLDASRRLGLRRLGRNAEAGLARLGVVIDAPAPARSESVPAATELGERLVTISEESYRRLGDSIAAAPEQLTVKGFAHPVAAYRIFAPAAPSADPLRPGTGGGCAKFAHLTPCPIPPGKLLVGTKCAPAARH